MSGEELKKKLDELGVSYAEVARQLDVFPQSFNKTLKALDVSSGTLEKICRAFGKDMSFFYDIQPKPQQAEDGVTPSSKESEVYRLWMEHMRITEKMQELYQKQKEE